MSIRPYIWRGRFHWLGDYHFIRLWVSDDLNQFLILCGRMRIARDLSPLRKTRPYGGMTHHLSHAAREADLHRRLQGWESRIVFTYSLSHSTSLYNDRKGTRHFKILCFLSSLFFHILEEPQDAVMPERFMRASSEISIEVTGEVTALMANDTLPPARINDLQVLEIDPMSLTVKLRWTAMGDDYDVGNGKIYIRCRLRIYP